jgi:Ni,Fe-hydrogenase III small subunit
MSHVLIKMEPVGTVVHKRNNTAYNVVPDSKICLNCSFCECADLCADAPEFMGQDCIEGRFHYEAVKPETSCD